MNPAELDRSKITVMVVEDEYIVGFEILHTLQGLGYRVVGPLATGEESIERAALESPDVVLMDIWLAGRMDGIEAAANLNARLKLPVIFATASSEPETRQRAMALAPLAFLTKPLNYARIDEILRDRFGTAA